jgi:hypothetical protein
LNCQRLTPPGRDCKDPIRLAKVASGRRHNRPFGNNQLSACLNGEPNVFFTDEVERRLVWNLGGGDRCKGWTLNLGPETAGPEEIVDPP